MKAFVSFAYIASSNADSDPTRITNCYIENFDPSSIENIHKHEIGIESSLGGKGRFVKIISWQPIG